MSNETQLQDASIRTTPCPCSAGRSPAAPLGAKRHAPYFLGLGVALTALAPKCPMCLAAYLSLFGIGGAAATLVHPLLRPLGMALCAVSVVLGIRAVLAARRRQALP
jgi:hypothetical protein